MSDTLRSLSLTATSGDRFGRIGTNGGGENGGGAENGGGIELVNELPFAGGGIIVSMISEGF